MAYRPQWSGLRPRSVPSGRCRAALATVRSWRQALLEDLVDGLGAVGRRGCLGLPTAGGALGLRSGVLQRARTRDAGVVAGHGGAVQERATGDDLVEPLAVPARGEEALGRVVQAAERGVEHRQLDLDLVDNGVEVGDDAVDLCAVVGQQAAEVVREVTQLGYGSVE